MVMKLASKMSILRDAVRRKGILHARDLDPLDVPKRYLSRLCLEGSLVKTGRGLYMAADMPETIHVGLAQAAKAVPRGVICLLSALRFHEIGTQNPHQIWLALDRRAARPRVTQPNIKVMRFTGKSLTEGIEEYLVAGVRVHIYNTSKTVADCFKYRNKIGLDVAIEALREAVRGRKCTADELWKFAKICRVSKVIRPYMEALL
jgi:predicted transcriptional regulator of viral defense system